jgi:predicted metal-dependent peptidase
MGDSGTLRTTSIDLEAARIECDAAVQGTNPYKGKTTPAVKGGGGTSFDPALAWVCNPSNGKFDACIYLTDGYASAPSVRPRCPMLWVSQRMVIWMTTSNSDA